MSDAPPFRFEAFADAPSAQAQFDAAYPAGSAIEPALRALVAMGAQCKSVGATRFACRYVENGSALAGWCWYVVLEAGSERTLQGSAISLAALGL